MATMFGGMAARGLAELGDCPWVGRLLIWNFILSLGLFLALAAASPEVVDWLVARLGLV